eukprot:CAMPEP_0201612640 /NCGR_PEP_ID=MMETSP0492-20130828/23679_1 /ASSEMBLY_ACC=CAM_ASM_000837 /TAXON_ID=420259 /ORGANISM="Thalassiosira gravida, Strain GMp14c1" /LENGTH=121 /DNA_ID=CAMNT_0048079221 /DNA_START=417 /DNA_END=782 /DNA_ORIENTATION=-
MGSTIPHCQGVQTVYSPVKSTSNDRFVITAIFKRRSTPNSSTNGATTATPGLFLKMPMKLLPLIEFESPSSFSPDSLLDCFFAFRITGERDFVISKMDDSQMILSVRCGDGTVAWKRASLP